MEWSPSPMIQNPYAYQGIYAEMPPVLADTLEETDYAFPQEWYTPECRSLEQEFLKALKSIKRIFRQQAILLFVLCALFVGHFACFYCFLN